MLELRLSTDIHCCSERKIRTPRDLVQQLILSIHYNHYKIICNVIGRSHKL